MKNNLALIAFFYFLSFFSLNAQKQINLSGTYTIGGTSPDYTNITMAVTALNTQGVSGPITFLIRPGTYNEQISISQITGASASNTVTFQSENNDSTSVILTYPSSSVSTNNYALKLNGADYVTFKKITLQRTGASNFAQVIDITGGATYNRFLNNKIIGIVTSNSTTNCAIISSSSSSYYDNYNVFSNNVFQYGSYGINFSGQGSTMLEQGTVISNNLFVNQNIYGINCNYQNSLIISGNTINTQFANINFCGIYAFYCDNALMISSNKIIMNKGAYGINLYYCDGITGQLGLVSNNFISIAGNTSCSGINVNLSSSQNIYYNSINTSSTDTSAKALNIAGLVTANLDIRNNVFAASGGGYCIFVNQNAITSVSQCDYNDLYATGTKIGYWGNSGIQTSLSAWQSATSLDANSINANPSFFSNTDLHSSSSFLNGNAIPLTSASTPVLTDIDGQTRNNLTPDIGADEFNAEDIGVSSIVIWGNFCLNDTAYVQIYIENYSINSFSGSVPVSYQISGEPVVNGNTGNITINSGDSILYTFPVAVVFGNTGSLSINASANFGGDINTSNDSCLGYSYTVHPLPLISISGDDTICSGDLTTLTAAGGTSYLWSLGYTVSYIMLSPLYTTTYWVIGTDTNGCSDKDSITIFVDTIHPVAYFGYNINVYNVTFTDSSINADSYYWNFGDGTNSNMQNPTHIYGSNNTYTVTLIASNTCSSDTFSSNVIINSINEYQGISNVNIFPNPSEDNINIDVSGLSGNIVDVRILNQLGQVIYSEEINLLKIPKRNVITINKLPEGIYGIQLFIDRKEVIFKKIIFY